MTTGIKKLITHGFHAVVAQQVAEDFEVAGLVSTCVLRYLLEVGKCTPLTFLVSDYRCLVGHAVLVVARVLDATVVVVVR